jgi:hypothetical protein
MMPNKIAENKICHLKGPSECCHHMQSRLGRQSTKPFNELCLYHFAKAPGLNGRDITLVRDGVWL